MIGRRTFSCLRTGLIAFVCLSLAPVGLRGATSADSAFQAAGADEGLRQAFERATYSLQESGHGIWRGANAAQRF